MASYQVPVVVLLRSEYPYRQGVLVALLVDPPECVW